MQSHVGRIQLLRWHARSRRHPCGRPSPPCVQRGAHALLPPAHGSMVAPACMRGPCRTQRLRHIKCKGYAYVQQRWGESAQLAHRPLPRWVTPRFKRSLSHTRAFTDVSHSSNSLERRLPPASAKMSRFAVAVLVLAFSEPPARLACMLGPGGAPQGALPDHPTPPALPPKAPSRWLTTPVARRCRRWSPRPP